jgi:benzaldehyde dehydrogenase (NAD)
VASGATLLTGGDRDGTFIRPAVMDHVDAGMRIYTEEIFGPAACIIRVRDGEEALQIANDTEYGLSGSIFTSDATRALEMASRWESGNVHINCLTFAVESHVPYGGVKSSGYGRFGGADSIREFTYLQTVTINRDQRFAL